MSETLLYIIEKIYLEHCTGITIVFGTGRVTTLSLLQVRSLPGSLEVTCDSDNP